MTDNELTSWEVFSRAKAGRDYIHVGNLRAANAEAAMEAALDVFTEQQKGLSVWVVPSDKIFTNRQEESDAFFTAAEDKSYRHATDYPLPPEVEHM